MGLTPVRPPARLRGRSAALALATALALGACIDELPLEQTDAALLFVDGAVLVDSTRQTLTLGRTRGVRVAGTPITDAAVEVRNLSTGERHAYRHTSGGAYVADFTGRLGEAYVLRLDVPGVGAFESVPDSLAPAGFTVDAGVALRVVRDADGEPVRTSFVTARLRFAPLPGRRPAGAFTVRQYLIWSYADQLCDVFDASDVCYFVERPAAIPLASLDLGGISPEPGDTAVATFGVEPLDSRLAQDSYLALETRRYGPAATAYYTALSRALNPSGSPFEERPLPAGGNLRAADPDGEGILGYFGVAEARPYYLNVLASEEVRARSVAGPCATDRRSLGNVSVDCCYCERTRGALTQRPSYLP